nr:substrate-binding domain-containing protein [Paraburkholderia phosphatilytica]
MAIGLAGLRLCAHAAGSSSAADAHVDDSVRQVVANATAHDLRWSGPRTGPAARAHATVAIVAEDLRNGGVLGVAQGVREAAGVIGWKTRIVDAGGTPEGRRNAIQSAIAQKPDGIVLIGIDAASVRSLLDPLSDGQVPVVGWHVAAEAGAMHDGPVAMNVSTDPIDVARVTAMAAVEASAGRAHVVIFTDRTFGIARAKADAMAKVIRACSGCRLLEVQDLPISACPTKMAAVTRDLLARYGSDWNVALAINDIYFDYAAPELTRADIHSGSISMLSAGDGSAAAFLRIEAGTFQTGTVADPLNMQGWQLIDELNRLLAHQPVTGYVAPVHLVDSANIAFDGGPEGRYDPDNGYRNVYRSIWKR